MVSVEENVVRDIEVEFQGKPYRATYFVEHGQIHVKTGTRLYRLPVTQKPAEQAVESLLLGLAADATREAGQAARWTEALAAAGARDAGD